MMLAGFQLQDQQMSSQQFKITRNLGRKNLTGIGIAFEKKNPEAAISTCSFRQTSLAPSSTSIVAQYDAVGVWRSQGLKKRLYDWVSSEPESSSCVDRTKRGRPGEDHLNDDGTCVGDECWFPASLEEEEKPLSPRIVREADIEKPDCSSSSGGTRCSSPEKIASKVAEDEKTQIEQKAFELVSLLMECVEALSSENQTAANYYLARLGEQASPMGSPVHRLVACFAEALALRVSKLWPETFSITIPRNLIDPVENDAGKAFRLLNHVCPIPMFLHFTMNERLSMAFEGKKRIHIIDLDIKDGLQWPALFQTLASRKDPPAHVRITGVGELKKDLQETGARLAALANGLNLPFEFHTVVDRLEDLRLWMLHVKEGECVAVNCLFQMQKLLLYDDNGATLKDFLGLIQSTNPAILVVANEEAELNNGRWEARVVNSLRYYSAIFDAIDEGIWPPDSAARRKIEEMFAKKIRNTVACEGRERVERQESFRTWRKIIEEEGGFRFARFGDREEIQSRVILRMFRSENYSVDHTGGDGDVEDGGGGGGLTLKWLNQPLCTVSAWEPSRNIAGSST